MIIVIVIIIITTLVNVDKRGVTKGIEPNRNSAQYCVELTLCSIPSVTPRLSELTIVIIIITMIIKPHQTTLHHAMQHHPTLHRVFIMISYTIHVIPAICV